MIGKILFAFPGQGSQYIGMGKRLCENHKAASDVFDEASDAISIDMRKLCFESKPEVLTQTNNAQPAILTVSYAMYRTCMEELDLEPDISAGHSLGEISALACAGAITLFDAVRIVRKRGELMQIASEGNPGKMAAVNTRDFDMLLHICEKVSGDRDIEKVVVSNINSKTQNVISGCGKGVEEAVRLLSENGVKVSQLNVNAPFHSPLMAPAEMAFREELRDYTFAVPRYPVLSNVTGQPYSCADEIPERLVSQIVSPVRWVECMEFVQKYMVQYGLEVGPGHVLQNLMRSNVSNIKLFAYDNSADADKFRKALEARYIPFISRCMGLAVATPNTNFDAEAYKIGAVKPYKKLRAMQETIEKENRKASVEEMRSALTLLTDIFATKKVDMASQNERIKELFVDTGIGRTLNDFQYTGS